MVEPWRDRVVVLGPQRAHHLMVEAIRSNVLPASRLPLVIEAWEEPEHLEFKPDRLVALQRLHGDPGGFGAQGADGGEPEA